VIKYSCKDFSGIFYYRKFSLYNLAKTNSVCVFSQVSSKKAIAAHVSHKTIFKTQANPNYESQE
jgi:hypothetical protein